MLKQEVFEMDTNDPLKSYRSLFHFPKTPSGKDYLYFCGNSLGLQSKHTPEFVQEELETLYHDDQ